MSVGTQLAALGQLLDGVRRGRRAGVMYNGHRDIFATAGYIRTPTFDNYLGLYERDGLARRLVDMPAKTTWREPPEIIEDGKPDGTTFTQAFTALAKRLDLWREFDRADRLAGIGRYAILLIGTRGVADDRALARPAGPLNGPGDVLYLEAYDEGCVSVAEWERNASNPRFRLPTLYEVQPDANAPAAKFRVHWSRVLHVAEGTLRDRVHGTPRLQPVLNRLFDLEKVSASTGESYWQNVVRILTAEIDPSAEFTAGQLDDLNEQLGDMVHDLRRQFIGAGVKLAPLPTETPNVEQVREFLFSQIAAAVGIPKRILFGNEAGDLASTTDQATYFGTIAERQRMFAEPVLVRAFIDRLLEWGALPTPETRAYGVIWPALFRESETAIADANLKRAQAAAALTPMGGDPMDVVEVDEDRNVWLRPTQATKPAVPEPLPEPPPEATEGDHNARYLASGSR